MSVNDKEVLLKHLKLHLQNRIDAIKAELSDIIISRDSESKSSAGDKYETGRAMMQIAQEQSEKQLIKQKTLLEQVNVLKVNKQINDVRPGAIVDTNHGQFFISIGLGEIQTPMGKVIAISSISPIGKAFEGKKKGDAFSFMEREYIINSIS